MAIKDSEQRKYFSCTVELKILVNCSKQNLFEDTKLKIKGEYWVSLEEAA